MRRQIALVLRERHAEVRSRTPAEHPPPRPPAVTGRPRPMNLAQVLLSGRDALPNAVAIHHGGHHLTYARAFHDVERIAAHLARHGVGPGQLVGADIHQPMSHWVVLLALMRLGAVSVSLTDGFERRGRRAPRPRRGDRRRRRPREPPPRRAGSRVQPDWLRAPPGTAATAARRRRGRRRRSGAICFTSGTSGRPKAIELASALLRARLAGTARRTRIDTRSVLWCGLGPDTAYGFTATLAAWLEGAAVVFSRGRQGAPTPTSPSGTSTSSSPRRRRFGALLARRRRGGAAAHRRRG